MRRWEFIAGLGADPEGRSFVYGTVVHRRLDRRWLGWEATDAKDALAAAKEFGKDPKKLTVSKRSVKRI